MPAHRTAPYRKDGHALQKATIRSQYDYFRYLGEYDMGSHLSSSIINPRGAMGCERRELPVASYVSVNQIRHSRVMSWD